MREIKFRIIVNNKLVYLPHKSYSLVFGDKETKILQFHRGTIIAEHLSPIIMEYIGLQDKNGTEIYEGDIIHFFGLNSYDKEIVKFEDGAFKPFNSDWLDSCLDKAKIIGNIYENSELL